MRAIRLGAMRLLLSVALVSPAHVSAQAVPDSAIPTAADAASSVVVRPTSPWALSAADWVAPIQPVAVDTGSVPFDLAVAHAVRRSGIQDARVIRVTADVAGFASVPGTAILAASLYGVGELRDRPDLSDVGLHTGQALAVAAAASLLGKVAAGRARPYLSPEDPGDFGFGRGIRGDRYQSFPSFHSAAAFAAATAIAADEHTRATPARNWIIPLAYGSAVLGGVSRIYQEKHWSSDVLVGAVVGTLSGLGVARYHD